MLPSFLLSFFFLFFSWLFFSCARYQRLSKERIYLYQWLADDTTHTLSLSFSEMRLSRTYSSQASWHGYSQEYQDAINRTKFHQSLGISRTQKRITLSQCLSVSRFCSSNNLFLPAWSRFFFFCPSLILDRRISTHSLPPAAAAFIYLPCHETFSQY